MCLKTKNFENPLIEILILSFVATYTAKDKRAIEASNRSQFQGPIIRK